ncbi:MAG: hypothetical protein KA436_09115 [Oligoflexales bacterium]|nr:hypothetical protein [Oligoflexales bacterium]
MDFMGPRDNESKRLEKSKISFHTCPTGCVHVTVGNITINMMENDFVTFAEKLHDFAVGLSLDQARKNSASRENVLKVLSLFRPSADLR